MDTAKKLEEMLPYTQEGLNFILTALKHAGTICDAVPNRAHQHPESPLYHLGLLVNLPADGDGQNGYGLIRDAARMVQTTLDRWAEFSAAASSGPSLLPALSTPAAADAPRACQGANCGATDGKSHSRECIEETAKSQGWTPTEGDFADCPKASAPEDKPTAVDFLPHDDILRFAARVLDSDHPTAEDRKTAAREIRQLRASIRPVHQASVPEPVALTDEQERTAFEAEMRCEEEYGHRVLSRSRNGEYKSPYTALAWATWKARAALAASQPAPVEARCQYCDGTGDVHSIDGEWRGQCNQCNSAALSTPVQAQAVAVPDEMVGEGTQRVHLRCVDCGSSIIESIPFAAAPAPSKGEADHE